MNAHLDTPAISTDDLELLSYWLDDENDVAPPAQKISRRDQDAAIPLSFAQQRLWVLDQIEPNGAVYNIPIAVRLHGLLHLPAFEQALNAIVQRHEVLRTVFKTADGQPVQMINAFAPIALPVWDLSTVPAASRETELLRLLTVQAQQAFDLRQGPVWRAALIKLAAAEHVFFFNVHHIAADAWSVEVFFRELAALYNAFGKNQPSPLPELPIQYADFSNWQRQWLKGETLETQLAYWRRRLAQAPPRIELPTDRPRPAAQTFSGAVVTLDLSRELSAALKKLSQQQKCTPFMTLLAAFKTLLQRYTGQDDIIVGTPIANRTRAEVETLIGCFVNTLVLRTNLSGDPSFHELLGRVNEIALEAYAHQDVPFEKLVEALQPQRDLSVSPFFQVMFIYQNVPLQDSTLAELTLQPLPLHTHTAKFDLTLTLAELPAGLRCLFEYNTDLFDAATIQRLAGHFECLLQSIVSHPGQRLSALLLVPESERRQMLVDWNATAKTHLPEQCFQHLFEAQVAQTPDAVAVVFENQQLTYRELNRRANQLARHLSRNFGVGPETLVGICMERSLEMVVGLLGVLKTGGAYVPLDPGYPPERLALVLEDAKVPVLLTQQPTVSNFKFSIENLKLLCLDSAWETIAQSGDTNPAVASAPENLAYAIYTSGSTGTPKGVAIPHRALANFLHAMRIAPGLNGNDILLAVTTLSFDIAGLEIYLPLTVGACVVIASREVAADGRLLPVALENAGATVMQATPATWRMLIENGWLGRPGLKILCGGEALPQELAKQLLEHNTALWNMYGPTETTIWSTVDKIENKNETLSIGRPIDNTQIYLTDRHGQIVPAGVHGHLHISGDGLARGYLNRPDLTAEKFIPAAFSDTPGARIYHTGDLARYLPDGRLDCLGRSDQQVKIRGFRIELGEIESIGAQHPAIAQIVVTSTSLSVNSHRVGSFTPNEVRSKTPGGVEEKRLVAYFVAKTETIPAVNELREFFAAKLPDYMIPSAFVNLPVLPLTPNGKIDRRALPAAELTTTKPDADYAAPQNLVEELLTEIWEEVLAVDRVGASDNFFELGGHSLLAVRLFVEIERSFHRSLPLASIFKAPTIKQLAALLGEAEVTEDAGCLIALQETGSQPPLFCVSGYEGHTFNFRQLARHLGSEQPIYGLHYPGLDGREQPLDTVEAIATEFIRHLQRLQPRGPYHFCGLCFGGLVVYEMARQLTQHGHEVARVILLDTIAPGGAQLINEANSSLAPDAQVEPAEAERAQAELAEAQLARWIAAVRAANIRAHERYEAKTYPGRVSIFLPKKRRDYWLNFIIDPLNGWGQLAQGGVETYELGGRHVKWFREPKVRRFARKMRECLQNDLAAISVNAAPESERLVCAETEA